MWILQVCRRCVAPPRRALKDDTAAAAEAAALGSGVGGEIRKKSSRGVKRRGEDWREKVFCPPSIPSLSDLESSLKPPPRKKSWGGRRKVDPPG